MQETSGATILANILPGLRIDEFLTRTDVSSGVTSFFLTDALGSPVAVADAAGAVQTEYTYESFGKTTITGASNTTLYHYTGRENDGTGLYYYRARYYDPQLQRFLSEDPIEFNGGDINLYAYVRNSPLTFSDPYGLEAPLPLPTFPGPGGGICIALPFGGAQCEPPPNKSNPRPPKPPEPTPPQPQPWPPWPGENPPYPYGAPPANSYDGTLRDPGTGEPIRPPGVLPPGATGLGLGRLSGEKF